MKAENIRVSALKPHPRNYRSHPDDEIAHIVASIKEHGVYRNVVTARDHTILAGHGVVQAATKMGLKTIPIVRLPIASDSKRALKLLAADNEISRLAETDDRALTELLKNLSKDDVGALLGTGFDAQQLAALVMVTRPASEILDFDAASAWVGMPEFEDRDVPEFRVVVSLKNAPDLRRFLNLVGYRTLNSDKKLTSIWWPARKLRADPASLKFVSAKK